MVGAQGVQPAGLLQTGNIDLNARPVARNPDGSISTVRSISANFDGREVLIPTVSDDGRVLSDEEAIDAYRSSGRNLGAFDSPEHATAYAQALHEAQAQRYALGLPIDPGALASVGLGDAFVPQQTPGAFDPAAALAPMPLQNTGGPTVSGITERPGRTLGELADDMATMYRQGGRSGLLALGEAPVVGINAINTGFNEAAGGLAGLFGQEIPADEQVRMLEQPGFLQRARSDMEAQHAGEMEGHGRMALKYDIENRPDDFVGALGYMAQHPGVVATDLSQTAGSMTTGLVPGAGAAGNIALQATQQASLAASDVEEALLAKGTDPETAKAEASKAFVAALGVGAVAPRIVPGGAALERAIGGEASDMAGRRLAARVAAPILGEPVSEGVEEGSIQGVQNVYSGDPIGQGVGGAAAQGVAMGLGMGAAPAAMEIGDALGSQPQPRQARRQAQAPQTPTIDPAILAAGNAALGAPPRTEGVAPQPADDLADLLLRNLPPPEPAQAQGGEPPEGAGGSRPTPAPPAAPPPTERPQAPPAMQNRDRSRPASVAQMQDIRKNPDAARLGFSRDSNTGAPMVSRGQDIPAGDLGRTDSVVMPDGRRVPVQYAVIETDAVQASHSADGQVNPAYDGAPLQALNNGRTAGVQAAWQSGNADGYRAGLAEDAELHGVPPEAIAGKRQPMLVRLYAPTEGLTGAESNASQQLGLAPVEQAQTDAASLPDLSGLTWSEDGSIPVNGNAEFFRSWFRNMGDTAAATLQDAQGRPNAAAVQRLRSAMIGRAYGDERLLTAIAEDVNPDNRNILNALAQAATSFATLEQGDPLATDVRGALVGGLELVREAANQGQALDSLLGQGDMLGRNEQAVAVARFMAANARSARRMADVFRALAEYTDNAQRQAANLDVFGGPPPATVGGALNAAGIQTDAGSVADDAAAGYRAGEPAGRGRAAAGDAGRVAEEQPGLFGEPTSREEVDAERRRRDDTRDGRAGTERTDMAAGDGDLFAGARPEQADIETGELPAQDISSYGKTRPLSSGQERGGVESPAGPDASGRAARGELPQLDLFVATRGQQPPGQGQPPVVKVDRAKLATSARLVETGQFRSGIDRVRSLSDAAHILAPLRKSAQERFMVLALDTDGRPLAVMQHSIGSVDGAEVHTGMVMGAIASIPGVRSVVFAHNHPSGSADPSAADRALDKRLADLFDGSGITVQGAIIVQPGRRTFSAYGAGESFGRAQGAFGDITPARRGGSVPQVERQLRRVQPATDRTSLSSPDSAKRMVQAYRAEAAIEGRRDSAGVILLNTRHELIGRLPFDPAQTERLRTGNIETSHANYIAQATEANAAAAILYGDKANEAGVRNMARAMKAADLRVLDTFLFDGDFVDSQASMGRDFSGGTLESTEAPADASTSDDATAADDSRDIGEAEADMYGLREAIERAVGKGRVTYLHGTAGLPDRMRRGVARRMEQRGGRGRTAALYDPQEKHVYLLTDVVDTPDKAVWNALHEIAGHHGLREFLGDKLDRALELAIQNPTVRQVADAIARERNIDTKTQRGRLLAAEEALAELAAAVRTGNFDKIASRYGVEVGPGIRERVAEAVKNFVRRLKALLEQAFGTTFSDADVRALLENAWQAAQADPQANVEEGGGQALESVDYTPEQQEFMRKAGLSGAVDTRTTLRRMVDWALGKKPDFDGDSLIQSGLDQLHGIKRAVQDKGITDAERNAYIAARQINTGSTMEAILLYGAPRLESGALRVNRDIPGLLQALAPVGKQMPQFLGWMVARRAQALKQQGRENLMSDADIKAGLELANGNEAAFSQAARDYLRLKNAILDLGEATGTIDPDARAMWDSVEYIPFYREVEGGSAGPGTRAGLANQSSGIRKLKGGETALKDPLGNIIQNFTRLVDSAMKNRATLMAVDTLGEPYFRKAALAVKPEVIPLDQVRKHLIATGTDPGTVDSLPQAALKGVQKMLAIKAPEGDDIVRVMRDGKAEYYHVDDPLLLRALTSFNEVPTHWGVKPFVWAKQMLTAGATATPEFIAANTMRDTGEAWATSKHRFIPLVDTLRGAVQRMRETELTQDLMMAGSAFHSGYFHTGRNEDTAKAIKRALRKHGVTDSAIKRHMATLYNPKRWWDVYRTTMEASEMGSRIMLAQRTMESGGSFLEGAFEAKDFLDFSMRGDDRFVQFFTNVLPFLNARLQGGYRLARVGTTKGRRGRLASRMAMIAFASTSLYLWNMMMYGDAYDDLEDWDKDAYWHIGPGTEWHTRIPKPFEIGLVAGTFVERLWGALEYQLTDGAKGDRPRETLEALKRGIVQTMAIDPIPQLARPIVEVQSNHNRFFDSPIESLGDRYKAPEDRFSATTSETMRAASRLMTDVVGDDNALSPKKLQHLWRGYTAGMGDYLLDSTDWVVRQMTDAPEQPDLALRDFPLVGRFARGDNPPRSIRYMDEFYAIRDKAQQQSDRIKQAAIDNDASKAQRIESEFGWVLGARQESKRAKGGFMHAGVRELNKAASELSKLRREDQAIYEARDMDGAAKRAALDENQAQKNELVRNLVRRINERERKWRESR